MNLVCTFASLLLSMLTREVVNGQLDNELKIDNGLATVCRPLDRSLDLLFMLDGSGSIGGSTWDTQMDMVRRIVDQIEIGPNKTRVAVIQYSGWTRLEFDFNEYKTRDEIKTALTKIRFLSGTTKTGRALNKAIETFSSEKGSRFNEQEVAKVTVLVSDGYSQDDAKSPAKILRSKGIELLALGIGSYVAMDELLKITDDKSKTFRNNSVDSFVEAFRKIAVGELCTYVKGPRGAEITCLDNSITVDVLAKKPFRGHLYVKGFYLHEGCSVQAMSDSVKLTIPLTSCGIQPQFMLQPRGMLFETTLMIKFHEDLTTKADKAFDVRCFYADDHQFASQRTGLDGTANDTADAIPDGDDIGYDGEVFDGETNQLVRRRPVNLGLQTVDDNDVTSMMYPAWTMRLPCAYTLRDATVDGCIIQHADVGQTLFHRWECDSSAISLEYRMLVHSCYITDGSAKEGGREKLVIDSSGCSTDPSIVPSPVYDPEAMLASVECQVAKFADQPNLQFRCKIRLCNLFDHECEGIFPPKCKDHVVQKSTRAKRQAALRRMEQMQEMFDLIHQQGRNDPWAVSRLASLIHTRPTGEDTGRPVLQTGIITNPNIDDEPLVTPAFNRGAGGPVRIQPFLSENFTFPSVEKFQALKTKLVNLDSKNTESTAQDNIIKATAQLAQVLTNSATVTQAEITVKEAPESTTTAAQASQSASFTQSSSSTASTPPITTASTSISSSSIPHTTSTVLSTNINSLATQQQQSTTTSAIPSTPTPTNNVNDKGTPVSSISNSATSTNTTETDVASSILPNSTIISDVAAVVAGAVRMEVPPERDFNLPGLAVWLRNALDFNNMEIKSNVVMVDEVTDITAYEHQPDVKYCPKLQSINA